MIEQAKTMNNDEALEKLGLGEHEAADEGSCDCCCCEPDRRTRTQRLLSMLNIPQYARVIKEEGGYDEYWMIQKNIIKELSADEIRLFGNYYGEFLKCIGKYVDEKIDFPQINTDIATGKRFIEIEHSHVSAWVKCMDELSKRIKQIQRESNE